MRNSALAAVSIVALIQVLGEAQALAQQETQRILLPAPSIVDPPDATAVLQNAGALALLESWSVVYLHAQAIGDANGSGDAVLVALPLFGGLSIGTGLEVLRPRLAGSADPPPRATGIFSFALGRSPTFGLGFTYRQFVSDGDPGVDGLGEWSGGLALRPASFFSLAATVHDLNTPVVRTSGPIPRLWTFGLGLRPLVRDSLTLLGEIDVSEDDRPNVPRGGIEVGLPWVGAARATVEHAIRSDGERELRVDVALDVRSGNAALGGGFVAGTSDERTGEASARAWTASARISGERFRGVPRPSRVRKVEVREGLDVRALAALTRRLGRDATDPSVDGVLLVPRSGFGGLSAASEVSRRIEGLRRRGRKVACHLEEATGSTLAACAAADRIWIGPAGGIRLVGVREEALFFTDLMGRLGIRAQIVKVGDYKSAPEGVTRMSSSDAAREQRDLLLADEFGDLVSMIARGRRLSAEVVTRLIDEGPFSAPDAIEAGLADEIVNEDEIDRSLRKLHGGRVSVEESPDPPEHPRRWGQAPAVAVIYVEDSIVDGESFDVPLLRGHFTGAETIAKALRTVREDSRIGAVVLRIESPGGSATASERIWREARRTARVKPVVASMGSIAASGGYYVAAAADRIFAERSTLTGSIGIFYGKADLSEMLREVGIGVEFAGRGRRAHMESMFRPYSDEEVRFLEDRIRYYYGIFVRRVATGRDKTFEQIDDVAQGRVWSGRRAKEVGLVDEFGGLDEAVREARRRGRLPWDAQIVELPERAGGLLDLVLGGGVRTEEPRWPTGLGRVLRALGPFAYLDAHRPQAMLDVVRLEQDF